MTSAPAFEAVETADSRSPLLHAGEAIVPGVVAGALATAAILLRWRGSDLPAQFFRVGLVERNGLEVWNNYWFGGHHTMGYGVLFPVLGAAVGIWTVAVASAALSAVLAHLLIRSGLGRTCWPASIWFAVGTVTNVAVGRLPFALGMAIGLGALLAVQHRHFVVGALLAAATSAASPVVSVFLVIVFMAWALVGAGRERRVHVVLAAVSIVPVLIVAALYPQGGTFPFRGPALVWTVVMCVVVAALVPERYRLVRIAAGLYALAALAAFILPTPVGANITRLGMYAVGPVLLALVPLRRALLALVLPFAWFWQWSPAFDAILRSAQDASTEPEYHQPLLEFIDEVGPPLGRVEVVPTARHWEAAFVALDVPIARGWERQLDKRFNPVFYEPGLTPIEYERWLRTNGVRFVALPDAPLDDSGEEEARIVQAKPAFLDEVWTSAHWRVYEVVDGTGLVDGPAVLAELGVDTATLVVVEQRDVLLRVRSSAFWVSDPPVCIEPTHDGWILLRDPPTGIVRISLDEADVVSREDPCAQEDGAGRGAGG